MTGYQELVTDPSYAGQILCFTAPMVGNYGVAPERSESADAQVAAVVMREARGPAWTDWLAEHGVVGLTGVDTRALVLHLREHGAMRAGINATLEEIRALPEMAGRALASDVSTAEPYVAHEEGDVRVAVVDYGCKRSILTRLAAAGAAVTVYPHDVDADELASYDGVLLSNGPGDPEPLRGRDRDRVRAPRAGARARHLPRPSAARARDRSRDVQAALRPPRREPSRCSTGVRVASS